MGDHDLLPRRRRLLYLAVGFVVGSILFAAWYFLDRAGRQVPPGRNPAAVEAMNRGVGLMEQFETENGFEKAIEAFEEASRLAPDWLPARINLGIALLNTGGQTDPDLVKRNLDRAVSVFDAVLKEDPNNLHAHYCLGIIYEFRGQREEAYPHYAFVTEADPTDAHAWYRRGFVHPEANTSPESKKYFQKALELDPYLVGAIHALANHGLDRDPDKTMAIMNEGEKLKQALWEDLSGLKYTEMGKYADAIGRHPDLGFKPPAAPPAVFEKATAQVTLPQGARWAKASDLGNDPAAGFRRAVRERFGGTVVLLDYNGDNRTDILLLGAVAEGGAVRDLLLRNDGNFRFTDVTAEAGLAAPRPSLGCAVGDFDNDGRPDLLLTGAGELRLFRNNGKGGFEDVSAQAGLDKLRGVYLAAAWVDLDQDGDLDLLLTEVAPDARTPPDLAGKAGPEGNFRVLLNVGHAPPSPDEKTDPPPLAVGFRPAKPGEAFPLPAGQRFTGLAVSDLDGDGDVDVLALADGGGAHAVLNDRLLRFHPDVLGDAPRQWNGALVLDANHDERSDVLLVPHKAKPELRLSKEGTVHGKLAGGFADGVVQSPPLKHAQAFDINLDGWTDVVGLSADGVPVLLQNDGTGRLIHKPEALGALADWPRDLLAVAAADLDDDCPPDLLTWSEGRGLEVRRNKGNGNRALKLSVSGRRHTPTKDRSNADGVGAWVSARAGALWTGQENTTLSAGLGQSRPLLHLGVGKATQADFVRILWPDTVPQSELPVAACQPQRVRENNRKGVSCPVLFAWDGERFVYVTDFLGAGSVGELSADGSTRAPRPEESVKLEPDQLAQRGGAYVLKVAEPMDELTYLDRLQLTVVDHPAEVSVFPDERFATGPPDVTQKLLAFRDRHFAKSARDHQGRDVTATLRGRDNRTVNSFGQRSWLGFAEEHWVELEFDRSALRAGPGGRLYLVLAGWTDYPYPESIFAATQAGVPLSAPVLERPGPDGTWQPICEVGFPAGLPRVMTRDVTGLLTERDTKLRIRTNMQVYWDQAFLAPVSADPAAAPVALHTLDVSGASLAYRGFYREKPVGRDGLIEYDPEQTERVAVSRWRGKLTRYGDVTELLTSADDRFAILGPGDEATVRFDASKLPPLRDGWKRSFVLRSWGYCKDPAPFTATAGSVHPLPFRSMKNFPPGPGDTPPSYQAAYDREWNTREPVEEKGVPGGR